MATQKLQIIPTIKEGILYGLKNIPSLLGMVILYAITIWIPYLNVGTTIGKEMDDLLAIADSLVINIGCLDDNEIRGMHAAAAAAVKYGKPWVIDPVGVGASRVRTETAVELITKYHPAIVRCNASEIMVLHGTACATRGVDSAEPVEKARSCAREFAAEHGTVVAVSGAVDYITDGSHEAECSKGSPLMARVTTMGCCASAFWMMPSLRARCHQWCKHRHH